MRRAKCSSLGPEHSEQWGLDRDFSPPLCYCRLARMQYFLLVLVWKGSREQKESRSSNIIHNCPWLDSQRSRLGSVQRPSFSATKSPTRIDKSEARKRIFLEFATWRICSRWSLYPFANLDSTNSSVLYFLAVVGIEMLECVVEISLALYM